MHKLLNLSRSCSELMLTYLLQAASKTTLLVLELVGRDLLLVGLFLLSSRTVTPRELGQVLEEVTRAVGMIVLHRSYF